MTQNQNLAENTDLASDLSFLNGKGLNAKQIHAIFYLASTPGITDKEVAKRINMSQQTLVKWRRLSAFKDGLDATILYLKKVEHAKEVDYIRECTYKLGKSLWEISDSMHSLAKQWLTTIDVEDLKPQEMLKLIEVYDKVSSSALEKMDHAWGIDTLLQSLDEKE
ncbi:MAG: hypothetical protein KME47_09910 [Nodosilinea sp. WJT8-NPBG4]|jgi:transposase-like protein|nr:hypothetical protein [Nodosilinea sp. WJT8-NPBG4]